MSKDPKQLIDEQLDEGLTPNIKLRFDRKTFERYCDVTFGAQSWYRGDEAFWELDTQDPPRPTPSQMRTFTSIFQGRTEIEVQILPNGRMVLV